MDPEPEHHHNTSKVGGRADLEGVGGPGRIDRATGGLMLNFLALASWSLHHLYVRTRICEQMIWHW